ncbi:MAG: phosphomannomutase/phosphoglucomutase [Candidatus Nealsonbacteria bacterium]
MKINPEIFRAYDIRGIVDKDLNPQVVELIGKAFGTYLLERGTKDVLVGRDTRATSLAYQKAITKGLLSTGCNVIDIGVIFASLLYFARQHYKIDGGIIITASHNPPEWNGFKLCHGLNAIVDEEIQKVKQIVFSGKFKSGKGKLKKLKADSAYLAALKKRIKLKKPLRVVVNCGNATSSIFVPKFLEAFGCKVTPLYCKIDSTFPHGMFDPANLEHYHDLVKKVKEEKADLGIMFDGDSDRVGFVDEKGNVWLGDIILILLIREILPKNPGRKVIVEVKDSELVAEETNRLGGVPIFWKTGHALLDHKVFEEKAILCGEMSCHYWITDNWYYFDDGIYAMARVLRIISNSEKSLSQLVGELHIYPATPEYRVNCPDDKKFKLVKELVTYFKKKCNKIIDVDGIRGYFEDGWFLIRVSNTQPVFVVRCEAKTKEGLDKIKKLIKDKLDEYPFITFDWKE